MRHQEQILPFICTWTKRKLDSQEPPAATRDTDEELPKNIADIPEVGLRKKIILSCQSKSYLKPFDFLKKGPDIFEFGTKLSPPK